VAQSFRSDALADDCERAALVVSARQPPKDCAAAAIDPARLRRQGALALWRKGDEFAIEAAKPRGFDRPWSPAMAGDAEGDTAIVSRPAPPRARDATPSEADLQAEE
jgi:competence protein ComEC